MQYERAQNILSGQTNLARKVFAAVPMQEFWSIGQISNEMNRVEKHSVSKGEITGCLRALVDAGLVAEAGQLTFRSNVKPPKPAPEIHHELPVMTAPTKKVQPPKPSLMEQLFGLATDLRAVAEKVESVAMEVDSAIIEAGKGDEKLRALQVTLRGLLGNE